MYAPKSGRSSRSTEVMTACCSLQLGDRRGDARGLLDVVRGRAAVRDRAVGAVTRADVAQDHEGGGAVLPALADVGAMGLFAHGMQLEVLA